MDMHVIQVISEGHYLTYENDEHQTRKLRLIQLGDIILFAWNICSLETSTEMFYEWNYGTELDHPFIVIHDKCCVLII